MRETPERVVQLAPHEAELRGAGEHHHLGPRAVGDHVDRRVREERHHGPHEDAHRKMNDGHRYARHVRRRQTSSPTIASASRNSASSRKPVANIQCTCSAGGCISLVLEVVEQARATNRWKSAPASITSSGGWTNEPPEALAVRVQQRDAVTAGRSPSRRRRARSAGRASDTSRMRLLVTAESARVATGCVAVLRTHSSS